MSEIEETIQEAVEHTDGSRLNSAIAVLVALSATFMALCNVKDGNIVQAMEQAQARSIDQWAYFQAKGTKQHLAEQMVEQLEFEKTLIQNITPETRALFDAKIKEYKDKSALYENEKKEIRQAADAAAKEYDRLNVHDDQFDATEACMSLAIALFGITALTKKRWLLWVGVVMSAFGFVLGVSGFLGLRFHPDFLAHLLG